MTKLGRPRKYDFSTRAEQIKACKNANSDKVRALSRAQKQKDNEESLKTAYYSHLRWNRHDMNFLRNNAKDMTVRNIAQHLGRTYAAVMVKARKCRIKLMTEDKMHGRLVTRPLSPIYKIILGGKQC